MVCKNQSRVGAANPFKQRFSADAKQGIFHKERNIRPLHRQASPSNVKFFIRQKHTLYHQLIFVRKVTKYYQQNRLITENKGKKSIDTERNLF